MGKKKGKKPGVTAPTDSSKKGVNPLKSDGNQKAGKTKKGKKGGAK